MANFGTPLEHQVKQAAAQKEKAWSEIGKNPHPGLQVWQIDHFNVKSFGQVGTFYEGDAFIVLSTTLAKDKKDEFLYDVHIWLGGECSQDEAGTAAYKMVELDDVLQGRATQHREVEGCESALFLSYFQNKGGLRLLKGGVESGFHHVAPHDYTPRLLRIYGHHHVRVVEVPLVNASLNQGDAFLLDAGMTLYEFQGSKCTGQQRVRCGTLSKTLQDERGGHPKLVFVSEDDNEAKDEGVAAFWKLLGGKGPVAPPDPTEDTVKVANKLFQVTDASSGGPLSLKKLEDGEVRKSELVSSEVYILDVGEEVFVWVGSKAAATHKKGGLGLAQQYLKDAGLPNSTPISRVIEGGENEVFTSFLAGERRVFTYAHPHPNTVVAAATPAAAAAHHWAPVQTHTVIH